MERRQIQIKENNKMNAVLVGIAGSHNAFSLSLYNLKAYAYQNSGIRKTSPNGKFSDFNPDSGTAQRVGTGHSSGKSP